MLDTILDIATSGGFGAITGLFGGYLQKKHELKLEALRAQTRREDREANLEEMKIENSHVLEVEDKKIEVAEAEGAVAVEKLETKGFVESIKNQAISTGITFVDGVRGLMRPIITSYLLLIATIITINLHTLVGGLEGGMTRATAEELYVHIIHQLIFLTVTAVSWWFASRGKA